MGVRAFKEESSPSWRPPKTPDSDQREKLLKEVMHKCIEIRGLADGWDGRGSKAPPPELIHRAADLGHQVVGASNPMPQTLSLAAHPDGFVQFSITGPKGREADLWIEDDSNSFKYVAFDGKDDHEGVCRIANYSHLAEWLAGRSDTL
jgi:hypothetical protein